MSDFQIFSDGAADITANTAEDKNISIIPYYVSLDGETYLKELEELSLESYYDAMINKNLYPKTSLPSVQDYIDAFTSVLEKGRDILCFNLTTTLSGSHQCALTAKEILEEKYQNAKIYIMNSWLATGAQELMVLEAARMRDNGLSLDQIWNKCEKMREKGRIMFMVGGLDHLQKGGRIGKVGAAAGGILKIKPLIELKGGEINLAGVVRSRKGGLKRLAEITAKFFENENPEEYIFTIGYTNFPEEVAPFQQCLKEALPKNNFDSSFLIGATISSHTGPGTLGVCFLKKYEYI